jgi:hypothetical protein
VVAAGLVPQPNFNKGVEVQAEIPRIENCNIALNDPGTFQLLDSPSASWPCDGVVSTQTASPLKSEFTKASSTM